MTIKDFLITTANILWGEGHPLPLNAGEVILQTLAANLTNKLMGLPLNEKVQKICGLQMPEGLTSEIIDNAIELGLYGALCIRDNGTCPQFSSVSMRVFKLINEINK